jgi:ABC-type antimicrobial peptide transport system permease subunit
MSVDPLVVVLTFRSMTRMNSYGLQAGFWVTVALGGLALILTISGLFSVLSYVVEQRAREIGVRLALGATTRHVIVQVLSESIRPVVIGLVAGAGLAAAVAIAILTTSIASEIGDTVNVADPVAYAVSIFVILTSCVMGALLPAVRASQIDPVATLRKD